MQTCLDVGHSLWSCCGADKNQKKIEYCTLFSPKHVYILYNNVITQYCKYIDNIRKKRNTRTTKLIVLVRQNLNRLHKEPDSNTISKQ